MAPNLSPQEHALNVWRDLGLNCKKGFTDAVCFDVDSTVIQDEGLDQIAVYCGVGDKVKELTNKAMGGNLSFREALKRRLDMIKPTEQQIEDIVSDPSLIRMTPGMRELVRELHRRGTKVFLVSGGFHEVIDPIAQMLGIPVDHVYANRLLFNEDGQYKDFDHSCETSSSGGKPRVINKLKSKYNLRNVVMIGDGMTDMECQGPDGPANAFIGFGGNVVREKVKQNANWFVENFEVLLCEIRPKADSSRTLADVRRSQIVA